MARDRKCILCETVHASKQEMVEHLRSMLHHRELEKLKGRDCGHECRVCNVSLVSLTDYAGHISSPVHKQNVEKIKITPGGIHRDEDYFDHTLVELVQKRKEQIRKEKEAAAAKLVQESADAKKREIQQRIKEAKERQQLDRSAQHLPYGLSWNYSQYNCRGGQQNGFRASSPSLNGSAQNTQGKSATWHAQAPPNFQRWGSGNFQGSRSYSQDGALGSPGGSFSNPNRLPWLSNQGSSYGMYGRNNISQFSANNRQMSYNKPSPTYPPPPQFFASPMSSLENRADESLGLGSKGMATANCEPRGKQSLASNPKLDKSSRWSPYSVNKIVDSLPGKDTLPNQAEHPKGPKSQEKTARAFTSSGQERKETPKSKHLDRSADGPSKSQAEVHPKPQRTRTPPVGPLQAPKLPETCMKSLARSKWKSSWDSRQPETPRNTADGEPPKDPVQCPVTENKDKNCQQNATKPKSRHAAQSSQSCAAKENLSASSSESIQSLQVSTSSAKKPRPAASKRDDPENEKEAPTSPPRDGATKETEDDDSPKGEASSLDKTCDKASGLSKLDLPPVLKRDLTKHISTKTKTGGHEPNLHSARRIRNLSESRRADSEKDSGLKPTVRQLISHSGSRRKVNWEQVYQEVRKKQDKGKGMPRFGIEMVPNEDQSQEEDNMAMLENFPWELLMEISPPTTSRKRSLSESSLAPPSEHSLLQSKETPRRSPAAKESGGRPDAEQILNLAVEEAQKRADKLMSEKAKALRRSDCKTGEKSSGVEQMDGQGTAKRRRTPGDVQSQEASGLEQDNKRRKTKSKTADRLHIDQLLAVSLREEELSRSLQTAETQLVQARAALDFAYMEMQRAMVVKQQISVEMSTLREKRIELLKGMQANHTEAAKVPLIQPKQEKTDPAGSEPASVAPLCSLASIAALGRSASPPPSFSVAIAIKQEPPSPVGVSSESNLLDNVTCPEYITAAEVKPEPIEKTESDARSPSGLAESTEKPVQATFLPDSKDDVKLSASSRRSPETCGPADHLPTFETPQAPNASPGSLSELSSGKRVRKLKKRKVLEKAHSNALPESSDTEMDAEASRPRWSRQQRRASSGSGSTQVSTSSLPRGGDILMEEDAKPRKQEVEVKMETGATFEQPLGTTSFFPAAHIPDSSRSEQPSLACNEVTSTSDMDICKSSESEMSFPKMQWSSYTSSGIFEGHQESVNGMQIHNGLLYTCSGDRTIKAFDLMTHKCVAIFSGHTSKVSCLLVSASPCLQARLYSGSSDQTIRCYSLKTQELEQQFNMADRVLCLHYRWKFLYAGLANGTVVTFDLMTNKQRDVFECHAPRAVSCLATSQEGTRRILLAGSYDSTISVRDAKTGLLLRTLEGHTKTVLCIKVVNDLVFSGSSDQCVFAHNIHSGELLRIYKGHSHAVTVVTVVGKVMVTACLDKQVRVYDIQSREQLQVYTGHSDMVTSMTVHQSKIYTGCYDGSVQAVEFNLTQNYRCRWHGCTQVFGVMAHLQQHMVTDHVTNQQTLRCRWKDCEEFLCARNGSKQAMLAHVQKHADEAQPEP
ncbi:zinc finger protein 106 [Hippocampus zosterae]|uniref:zinc finger protein 106 n=1 Tax=Hippocampus zosterae TaxID=109293 RepID=UPI00223D989B|nr:zinc finger protein 106 [Hippocampus zosterae]